MEVPTEETLAQQSDTVRALLTNLHQQHVAHSQLSAANNLGFNLQDFMKQVCEHAGLPRDSQLILEATTTLENHGFCSRATLEGLTQELGLEYLKLPLAVWISMRQLLDASGSASQSGTPLQSPAPILKPRKKKVKEQITRLALQTKIGQFCEKIGHDQDVFVVKDVDLVQCLVCDSTFKLHKPGQITRLKRHINGETGSQKITRHMRNLIYPKPKDAEKSPVQSKKQIPPYRKRNFQHSEQQMAMQHLKRQRLDLDSRAGIVHCHCLQPAKRMISKGDQGVFWICSKIKPEQCDFFQMDGAPPTDAKSLPLEMSDMEADGMDSGAEKEGEHLSQTGEESHLMLGSEEIGDDHTVLRDFDIQEKGLVIPPMSYLANPAGAAGTAPNQDVTQQSLQAAEQH